MAFLPSSQDCSKSAMNSNLRKKFTSPFSVKKYPYSRATAAKLSPTNSKWKADQSQMPSHIPCIMSEAEAQKGENSRVQENYMKFFDENAQDVKNREPPRQRVYRSLFCDKSPSLESHPEKQNHEKNIFKLPVPEMLHETNFMEATNSHFGLETFLDPVAEVAICYPSDFCKQLKHQILEKFKATISPSKLFPPNLPVLPCPSVASIIETGNCQDFDARPSRGLNNKEGPIQIVRLAVPAPAPLACKRNTIRDPSNLVCSRDRSYQEQSEEFQQILSSKVRQIAEVAECLQHNELLYKILQI